MSSSIPPISRVQGFLEITGPIYAGIQVFSGSQIVYHACGKKLSDRVVVPLNSSTYKENREGVTVYLFWQYLKKGPLEHVLVDEKLKKQLFFSS